MKKHQWAYLAVAAASCVGTAQAADGSGLEVNGYSRGGGVFNYNRDQQVKGGLSLGGDLQKFRLGNEGDYGLEVSIAKTFDAGNGRTFKLNYTPSKWNNGNIGTEQAYIEFGGLDFAPEAKVWAGQHRQRIQDIHIVDHFLMDYGVNQGFGITDLAVGNIKLGAALQSGDTFDQKNGSGHIGQQTELGPLEHRYQPRRQVARVAHLRLDVGVGQSRWQWGVGLAQPVKLCGARADQQHVLPNIEWLRQHQRTFW